MKIQLLGLLLFSTVCSAQKIKVSVDKITGDTLKTTGLEKIYSKVSFSGTVGEQLKVATGKTKVGVIISCAVQTGKSVLFAMDKDSKLFLKLLDGSVITMRTVTSSVSDANNDLTGSRLLCHFLPTAEDVLKLKSSGISYVRIETSRGNMDYDIKGKFSSVVSEQLTEIAK
jgi:hypothetical protein